MLRMGVFHVKYKHLSRIMGDDFKTKLAFMTHIIGYEQLDIF
ncbi:hypothetical protein XIS1_450029 [Xenorhabdus innexi]|uniref:Uncharacterized protein n=1 Tax=Xenorhabdus innexi TaxID=290109 RepID=A0A1N6MXS9_9GAMM|nr:hypothetical protein XIS1_450029 [Xenorhabdus innexi]